MPDYDGLILKIKEATDITVVDKIVDNFLQESNQQLVGLSDCAEEIENKVKSLLQSINELYSGYGIEMQKYQRILGDLLGELSVKVTEYEEEFKKV